MASLRDDGGTAASRDHHRKRALQLACGGALSATSAVAWAALLRPDIVPAGLEMNGSAALVIGLAGLAALGLVAVSARSGAARSHASDDKTAEADPEAAPSAGTISQLPGVAPMQANVMELANALTAARISRVLLLAPPGRKAAEAVALARCLAERNDPTILVDLDGGCTVGDIALLRNVESIAHIAASPTTFAHGIQRDRSGRAHVLAARLDAPRSGSEAASVLATLEEVYARVVTVLPADAELIAPLVHADTALVVPRRIEREEGLMATIGHLAALGLGEVVLLDDAEERAAPASRRVVAIRA